MEISSRNKVLILILLGILLSSLGTASTISVSDINYTSNSSFYSEDHLQIQFIVDGTGETASVTVPSSQLSSLTEGETEQNLKINADIEEISAEYGIQDRNLPQIKDILYVREEFGSREEAVSWAKVNCLDPDRDGKPNYEHYSRFRIIGWDHYINCATVDHSKPILNVGFIQSPPDTTVEVNWTVKAEDKPSESAVLSNSGLEAGSIERIGKHTQIEFISLRDLGSQAPNPQNTLAAYSSQTGWKLISQEKYFEYRQYFTSQVPENVENMPEVNEFRLTSWKENKENIIDSKYTEAQSYYGESSISGSRPPNISYSGIENGVLIYEPENNFKWFVSEFLIRIDGAEYLEIEKTIGEPKIEKVISGAEVTDISSDIAEISVKNIGKGRGLFEGRAVCNGNSTSEGISMWKSVEPGGIVVFTPLISASSNDAFNSSCRFIVEDKESTLQASTTFDVRFSEANECKSGKTFVQVREGLEVIYRCADNSVDWIKVETCGKDEHAVSDKESYTCQKIKRPTIGVEESKDCEINISEKIGLNYLLGNHLIPDPYCKLQNRLSNVFTILNNTALILEGILISFIALLGWFFGAKALSSTKKTLLPRITS